MPEHTKIEGDTLYFGDVEFTTLMKRFIAGYKFRNDNKSPKRVLLPNIHLIDGVAIEFESNIKGGTGDGTATRTAKATKVQ